MESGCGQGSGLRSGGPGGKKMRKRKELDALVRVQRGRGTRSAGEISPQDQLLSESTPEEDCPRLGLSHHKSRSGYGSTSHGKKQQKACAAMLRLSAILLIMACVVATTTVMWLYIDIKEQTTVLRSQLDQVSAGNEAITDAIQKCHSLSRQLEKNQTKLISEIQQISQRFINFTNAINSIQLRMSEMEKKLNDSAELATSHGSMRSLMSSVAVIGGQLNDFNITTYKISNEQRHIIDEISGIRNNMTLISRDLQELSHSAYHMDEYTFQNKISSIVQEIIEKKTLDLNLVNNTYIPGISEVQNTSDAHSYLSF